MKFDSPEEEQFYEWLKEAERVGLVSEIEYQPKPFKLTERVNIPVIVRLKTKTKVVDRFLLHPHSYTADFSFLADKSLGFITTGQRCWVDVKGGFSRFHDAKSFSINQKFVFFRFGIYINKVVPEKLFKKTFVPEVCRFTLKQQKPVKKYANIKTITKFLKG